MLLLLQLMLGVGSYLGKFTSMLGLPMTRLGHFNDDAPGDWGADAGDELAVNAKSVPLFHNCQGVHRSKNINGAVFRMNLTTDTVAITGASALRRLADFFELTKPRIVLMVLVTAFVGFYVGSEKIPDYLRLLQLLLGTALAAGGTLALNQFLERDTDAMMERTRHRPLPDGRVQPREAVWFGTAITIAGLVYLALVVNIPSAWVTASITLSYLFLYTPLKRRSSLCMLVGAVPGALPPVIGWVAARGEFQVDTWVLFAIMFLWQVPHTLAIARLYRDDFAKAGIQFLPVIEPDGSSTSVSCWRAPHETLVLGFTAFEALSCVQESSTAARGALSRICSRPSGTDP